MDRKSNRTIGVFASSSSSPSSRSLFTNGFEYSRNPDRKEGEVGGGGREGEQVFEKFLCDGMVSWCDMRHPGRQEVSLPISCLVNGLGRLGGTGAGEACGSCGAPR